MTEKNYRGRFEGEDITMTAENPTHRNQTIHKAIAAFISSLITLLTTLGIAVPWLAQIDVDQISWWGATLVSLSGSSVVSVVTYLVANYPKKP